MVGCVPAVSDLQGRSVLTSAHARCWRSLSRKWPVRSRLNIGDKDRIRAVETQHPDRNSRPERGEIAASGLVGARSRTRERAEVAPEAARDGRRRFSESQILRALGGGPKSEMPNSTAPNPPHNQRPRRMAGPGVVGGYRWLRGEPTQSVLPNTGKFDIRTFRCLPSFRGGRCAVRSPGRFPDSSGPAPPAQASNPRRGSGRPARRSASRH